MMTVKVLSLFIATNIIVTTAKGATERKDQRIVGGEPAPPDRFPYYAQYDGLYVCGSTLIYDDIVVGAAHCCAPTQCGLFFDSTNYRSGTSATVEKYKVHPNFNAGTLDNDIILMKLRNAPSGVSHIDYNSDGDIPALGQELTTVGFGATQEGGFLSDELLQVTVNYVDPDECAENYSTTSYTVNEDTMLCAADQGQDACQGDSGGPIFDADDGTGNLVGVVSWGVGCARETKPGVYTRISNYDEWIQAGICCMSDYADCECPDDFGSVKSCNPNSFNDCYDDGDDNDDGGFSYDDDIFGDLTDSLAESSGRCLSPDATALVETKGKIPVKDVVVGDKVMTASGEYKPVFTISHFHPDKPTTFVRVETDMDDQNPLELTPLHMLFVQGKETPIPAKDLNAGDFLRTMHGPQEVTSVTVVNRNGFYNPVTPDGTIVVDGVVVSTYTSLNGGSHLEIDGMQLISFQSLLDLTVSPYRAFCTGVSLNLCNQFGSLNGRPVAVHFVMRFYEFWQQQTMTGQCVVLFAYLLLFGLARIMFSPVGILLFVASFGMMICRHLSSRCFTLEKNGISAQMRIK